MSKVQKRIALFLLCLFAFCIWPHEVYAKENTDGNLSINMQLEAMPDNTSTATVNVTIKNIGNQPLNDIKLIGNVPNGFQLIGENQRELESLAVGSSETLQYQVKQKEMQNIGQDDTNSNGGHGQTDSSSGLTNIHKGDSKTGDSFNFALYFSVCCISLVFIGRGIVKKKKAKKVLSVLLCFSLLAGMIGGLIPSKTVKASEQQPDVISVAEELEINQEKYMFEAKVSYQKPSAIVPSGETLSRAEWITELLEAMGYSDFTVNYDEESLPFTDISSHSAKDIILLAYGNAILPETTDSEFSPNIPATREFVAYTTVHALGFQTIQDLVCDDADELLYKEEAETAVAMDLIRLSENKFFPKREFTRSEAEFTLKGVKKILDSENVDESYDNEINYKENVIIISENIDYEVRDSTVGFSDASAVEKLEVGSIFVLPDQTPYKVTSVTKEGERVVVSTQEPEIEKTLDAINVQGPATVDMSNFIPAEGVSFEKNNMESRGNLTDITGSVGGPGSLSFSVEKKIDDIGEFAVSLSVDLPKILYKADVDIGLSGIDVNNVFIKFPIKVEADGSFVHGKADGNLNKTFPPVDGLFELGKIPVVGIPGVTVYVELSAEYSITGEVHIISSLDGATGVQVLNNRLRMIKDLNMDLELPALVATVKLGAKVSSLLEICRTWDLIEFSLSTGGALSGTYIDRNDSLWCLDGGVYVYGEFSALEDCMIGDWLNIEYSFEFWTYETSPIKLKGHMENFHVVDDCTYNSGVLKGAVVNAEEHNIPIKNATIVVHEKGSYERIEKAQTDAQGHYEVRLPEGNYVVIISAEGYLTFEYDLTMNSDEEQYVETFLMIDEKNIGLNGVAEGTVTNAVTGKNISDATVSLRKGWNKTEGEIVFTTTTDMNGKYQVELPIGNYTAHFEKTGYTSNHINIVVLPVIIFRQNATLNPKGDLLPEGELRIVLTWGEQPRDLDSHLIGPKIDSSECFHIYFRNKKYKENGVKKADLDLDDVSSYGPETTTIYEMNQTGTYSFYVHDFTNKRDETSTAMSMSGATVTVYKGDVICATYPVPANKKGTYWHVFDFDVDSNMIIPINEFTNGIEYPKHIRSDSLAEFIPFEMTK